MQVETFVTKRIKKSPYECTVIFIKKKVAREDKQIINETSPCEYTNFW